MFDLAICLTLDKRIQLATQLSKQIEETFKVPCELFIAGDGTKDLPYHHIDDSTPPKIWGYGQENTKIHHRNAFSCHQKMLQICKKFKVKSVLFLEDDAYVTDRAIEVLSVAKKDIEKTDWNYLALGWWIEHRMKEFEDGWNHDRRYGLERVTQIGGLHGVVLKDNLYDLLLSMPPINPIDMQLNQYCHQHIKSYFLYPKIIHVHSTYSFCEGGHVDREHL